MKIVWTPLALTDLDEAYNFIAATNPSGAIDTIDHIEKALSALIQYPDMGRTGRIPGTKELVITRTPFIVPRTYARSQINHNMHDGIRSFQALRITLIYSLTLRSLVGLTH